LAVLASLTRTVPCSQASGVVLVQGAIRARVSLGAIAIGNAHPSEIWVKHESKNRQTLLLPVVAERRSHMLFHRVIARIGGQSHRNRLLAH